METAEYSRGELVLTRVEYIPVVETNPNYSVIERYIVDKLTHNPFVPIETMRMASHAHSYQKLYDEWFFHRAAQPIVIKWCRSLYGDAVLGFRGLTLYKDIVKYLEPYMKGLEGE
jgi:hypothetical protein